MNFVSWPGGFYSQFSAVSQENMGYGLKVVFVFVWISSIYLLGIFLFSKGFLLKRSVIPDKSNCFDQVDFWKDDFANVGAAHKGCWTERKYSSAVIIIIDALRFDFARYNPNLSDNETLPFQNKFEVIHEVLTKRPQHGRLYRFVADPPTTTMQRLKGLTTGKNSLPPLSTILSQGTLTSFHDFEF